MIFPLAKAPRKYNNIIPAKAEIIFYHESPRKIKIINPAMRDDPNVTPDAAPAWRAKKSGVIVDFKIT